MRRFEKECESGVEYLLPDYMGDVKKLLISKARVVPAGKFVSDGSVEVSGSVEYDLLYLDSSGKLTSVNAASDFTESFALDSDSYIDSMEESRVEALKVRVTGPRKISLKADVKTILRVSMECENLVDGNVFSDEGRAVEKCLAEVRYASSVFGTGEAIEYAEVLESFDDLSGEGAEIISVSAVSKIADSKIIEGEVCIKGENIVSAVLMLPEGAPRVIKKPFVFEERIAVEGVKDNMSVIPKAEICSVNVNFSADGEYMSAIANFSAKYGVELIENKSVEVVTDAYTPSCECKNKYSDADFSELLDAGKESFSVTVKCSKDEEFLSKISEVICSSIELRSVSSEVTDDGGRFCGEILISGLGYEMNVDGTVSYIPFKMQGSFDEKVNFDCQIKGKTSLDAILNVEECEFYNDDTSIAARCIISVKYRLLSNKTVRVLSSCEAAEFEDECDNKCTVTVYYPKPGERLFDIAKKYKTTSLKIATDNELSDAALLSFDTPASLVGVKKLIIR